MGGVGRCGEGAQSCTVPRVPNPKLIPERDGSGGVPWDTHLRLEVSDARRLLNVAPEAPGRSGGVYIYRHLVAEMLQLERFVSGYVAVRGLVERVSPGRVGCRSLAVVALEREMLTRLPFRRTSRYKDCRHTHSNSRYQVVLAKDPSYFPKTQPGPFTLSPNPSTL